VKINRNEGAKETVVLKYCTCMNTKMDRNEIQSIREWEQTHVAEQRACSRTSGSAYGTMSWTRFAGRANIRTRHVGIGKLRIERGRGGMRWCFTDPAHADDFRKQIGGERITDRWW
jgi:hypothetical protein